MAIDTPFKFLDYYTREDKQIYFGRESEIRELYERVFQSNLILVYGASGTGKTSLINCGLGNCFESADWLPISIRRKENLNTSFRTELSKAAVKPLKPEASLTEMVKSVYLDYLKTVYLIFDQFEELFILGKHEEQDNFFMDIRELLMAGLSCKIIISMREDYVASLSDFEKVVPELFQNRFRVEKMSPRQIDQVIQGSAMAFNIEMDQPDKVVAAITENLRDSRGNIDLTNLQVYLDRLYRVDLERKAQDNRNIRFDLALIKEAGELDDVMSDFLTEQIAVLDKELLTKGLKKKGIPLDILFSLVTDNATKQTMEETTLREIEQQRLGVSTEIIDYCLKRFKEMRIIREINK